MRAILCCALLPVVRNCTSRSSSHAKYSLPVIGFIVRGVNLLSVQSSRAISHDVHRPRWMMHRTGSYKTINLTFGICPFIGALLVMQIKEDSGWWQKWFSIVCGPPIEFSFNARIKMAQIPLGFGNAVVLQTVLSM